VAAGEADVFEVVVLAAGADAFLRGGSASVVAGLGAEEDIFELIHARVGEEQCGVVGRNERRGVHAAMALALKKPQELFSNLITGQDAHRVLSLAATKKPAA